MKARPLSHPRKSAHNWSGTILANDSEFHVKRQAVALKRNVPSASTLDVAAEASAGGPKLGKEGSGGNSAPLKKDCHAESNFCLCSGVLLAAVRAVWNETNSSFDRSSCRLRSQPSSAASAFSSPTTFRFRCLRATSAIGRIGSHDGGCNHKNSGRRNRS